MENQGNENKEEMFKSILFVSMVIIGAILLKAFLGINFWLMLGVILFFFAVQYIATGGSAALRSKPLAVILAALFVLSLTSAYWEANFPHSYSNIQVLKDRFDQTVSRAFGDRTQVKAEDIWMVNKKLAEKEFILYYDRLIKEGKKQEAIDTLKGFQAAWDSSWTEKEKSEKEEKDGEDLKPFGSQEVIILENETRVFFLEAGEETPWIGTPDCKKSVIKFSSPKNDYEIITSDGGKYASNVQIPKKEHNYYKVKSFSGEAITVSVRVVE